MSHKGEVYIALQRFTSMSSKYWRVDKVKLQNEVKRNITIAFERD